jgi:serine protease inhibitor
MINATNPPRNLEEKIDDANSRINTIKTNYIKNSDKISIFFATMNYIYTFESSVDNTNQLDENTRSLIKNIIDNKKENINAYTTLGNIIQIYFKDPGQLARDAVVASTDEE